MLRTTKVKVFRVANVRWVGLIPKSSFLQVSTRRSPKVHKSNQRIDSIGYL